MFVSVIIVFREALEAGLIVGIVLAATEGVVGRGRFIAGGIAAGAAGACLVAAFAGARSNAFEGVGQEAFTAGILIFAVVMLGWHVLWVAHHGRELAAELKQVGHAVRLGQRSLMALAAVIAVAVLREGAEVVLFLFGIIAATHVGTHRSPGRRDRSGAGGRRIIALVSRARRDPAAATVPCHKRPDRVARGRDGRPSGFGAALGRSDSRLGDTGFIVADGGFAGRSLHALIGYSARPSGVQVAAWVATLLILVVRSRTGRVSRLKTAAAVALTLMLATGRPAHAGEPGL